MKASCTRSLRRSLAGLMAVLMAVQTAVAGAAEPDLTAPAERRPVLGHAGAATLVDIARPDASGRSHNMWNRFDVSAGGLVLNNAVNRTRSALAGDIEANLRLGGTAATLIVNEVSGGSASTLRGLVEVAGTPARVIIANPNGIHCDGCGFIGTPHVQLTTGRLIDDSARQGFDVSGGYIEIGPGGLTALASRLDLLAQTLRSRGEIRVGGELRMLAGAVQVDAETLRPPGSDAFPTGAQAGDVPLAIDIGQTVAADSIQLIALGGDIGVRTTAPLLAARDVLIATRRPVELNGEVSAGRDIALYTSGASDTRIDAEVKAGRDLTVIATVLTVSAEGALVAAGRTGMDLVPDNSDRWSALTNDGRIEAGGDLALSGAVDAQNRGLIRAGGRMDAAAGEVTVPDAHRGLPGSESRRGGTSSGEPARLHNSGRIRIGQDGLLDLAGAQIGDIEAGRDLMLWWAPDASDSGGRAQAGRDLYLFLPRPDQAASPPQSGGRTFRAAQDLLLLPAPDKRLARDELPAALLALAHAEPAVATRDHLNRDALFAGRDFRVRTGGAFDNAATVEAQRDIDIVAQKGSNATRIEVVQRTVDYEYYEGCRTEYDGQCSVRIEQPGAPASMVAGRDLSVRASAFENRGARVLAGRDIALLAPDVLNEDRRYGATWQSNYSLVDPRLASDGGASCGGQGGDVCKDPIEWQRSASGSVDIGVLPGIIQAGGRFGAGPADPGATPPQPLASVSDAPLPSRFVNAGELHAASVAVHAQSIRNGFDVVADYGHRTAQLMLPPTLIDVTGTVSTDAGMRQAGAFTGAQMMSALPPALRSPASFAYTPEQEIVALRDALLAATHRAWILPGLAWDPVTGLSPDAQQRALLAANGMAFALEHGIAFGTPLRASQLSSLAAPMLWYIDRGGQLRPQLHIPASWQQQLAIVPGGVMAGDVDIVLNGEVIDNTGFVLSDGDLSVSAGTLRNRKRSAYYYEEFDVSGGTLIVEGSQVQPGGFMQAARLSLDVDRIESLSGEFRVLAASTEQSATETSAFEARLVEQLGDDYVRGVARDDLHYRFEKDSGFGDLLGMAASFVVASMIGPEISSFIGGMASSGSTFAGASALGTAGLGNTMASAFLSQTVASSVGQVVSGRGLDFGQALSAGLTGGLGAGSSQWANTAIDAPFERFMARTLAAGVIGEVTGGSFDTAMLNAAVNQAAALGSGRIGDGVFGQAGTPGHLLAHAALGALSEAARGGDPMAGALGAMTAVLVEQPLDAAFGLSGSTGGNALLTALSMLAGGAVTESAGGNPVSGGLAAQNVTLFNYLTHAESQSLERLRQKCAVASRCTEEDHAEMQRLGGLDRSRDQALQSACSAPSSTACQSAYLDLARAVASYQGQRIEPGSVADRELSSIRAQEVMYRARMTNALAYNVVGGATESVVGGLAGTIQLGTLLAQAPFDPAAREVLSQIGKAAGEFMLSPVDTVERGIKSRLDEAAKLEAEGDVDGAQRLRASLVTDGLLTLTGGTSLVTSAGRRIAILKNLTPNGRLSVAGELVGAELPLGQVNAALSDVLVLKGSSQSGAGRNVDYLVNERAAEVALKSMEVSIRDAHFVARHGPETSLSAQKIRAETGKTPDGQQGRPIDASRWASYQDMLDAIQKAQSIHAKTGQTSVTVDLGRVVGDGYLKGGANYLQTTKAVVRFDSKGAPFTAYPKLR